MISASFLESYMDDSGSHAGAPVSVVAGYFGGHRRWLEFQSSWKSVLDKYHVTEFHASKFWNRNRDPKRKPKPGKYHNEFDGWPERKGNEFLEELLTIIERSKCIHPFAVGVLASEWDKQDLEKKRVFTGASSRHPSGKPSKSMFMAFQRCVIRTATYCRVGRKIHYFLDDDPSNAGWADICYSQIKQRCRDEHDDLRFVLGDFTTADSVDAKPLQAADLLAYEARFHGEQVIATGNKNLWPRPIYARALRNLRSIHDFWLFDKSRFDNLDQLLAGAADQAREEGV